MKQILFATGNPSKVKRFSDGLKKEGIEIISLKDIDIKLDIEENGKNAIENALIKARSYSQATGLPTIAMDDNLFLENVPEAKQPGVYVRRVNGKTLSDEEMIAYYSNLAEEYGTDGKITSRWIYGMALIKDGMEKVYTWSKEDFYLVNTPSQVIQSGYPLNTISINKKLGKYFTDLTEKDKLLLQEDESTVIDFIAKNI